METVADILGESFDKARAAGQEIGRSTVDEAAFLGMSPGHLSRIRNARVTLTDAVIEKISSAFAGDDKRYQQTLGERLRRAEMIGRAQAKSVAREKRLSTSKAPSLFAEYSIEKLDSFFERLSVTGSMLAVDYRDLPQTRQAGRYPKLASAAAESIKNGLTFALFQPFGNPEKILEKETSLRAKVLSHPDATPFLNAYHYLFDLAVGVRDVYKFIKEQAGAEAKGSIALYEAVRFYNGKEIALPLTACGIQSRLFYADYSDSLRHYKEVYEWVVAHPDNDFFIQRDEVSINLAAVRLQFSPILTYWAKYKSLPVGKQVEDAYDEFVKPILGEEAERVIRWKDWTEK